MFLGHDGPVRARIKFSFSLLPIVDCRGLVFGGVREKERGSRSSLGAVAKVGLCHDHRVASHVLTLGYFSQRGKASASFFGLAVLVYRSGDGGAAVLQLIWDIRTSRVECDECLHCHGPSAPFRTGLVSRSYSKIERTTAR